MKFGPLAALHTPPSSGAITPSSTNVSASKEQVSGLSQRSLRSHSGSAAARTSRSSSMNPTAGQLPKSRSGSAAAPRFTVPVRAQKALIVADTCGLMTMEKYELQAFADYLSMTGEFLAVPWAVLSEPDGIQKDFSKPDRQYKARQAREWVRALQDSGYIRVQNADEIDAGVGALTGLATNDDQILAYAVYLQKQEATKLQVERRQVKLLTVDETLRIKAKGLELGVSYPTDFTQ